MERKDLLLDQIEQVGRALSNVLANFLGTGTLGYIEIRTETAITQLRTEVGVDLSSLFELGTDELMTKLTNSGFDHKRIEQFGDLLASMVEPNAECADTRRRQMLDLALKLYGLAGSISSTYSMERNEKEINVQRLIEACS
ncbi:MAG: hypothetical protein WAR83_14725 [Flavobacteriales bacterium]|nr:hypothetical protein [Flavobacteriales bacterium]